MFRLVRHLVTLILLVVGLNAGTMVVSVPTETRLMEMRRFDELIEDNPSAPVVVRSLILYGKTKTGATTSELACNIVLPTLNEQLILKIDECRYMKSVMDREFYYVAVYVKLWARTQKKP